MPNDALRTPPPSLGDEAKQRRGALDAGMAAEDAATRASVAGCAVLAVCRHVAPAAVRSRCTVRHIAAAEERSGEEGGAGRSVSPTARLQRRMAVPMGCRAPNGDDAEPRAALGNLEIRCVLKRLHATRLTPAPMTPLCTARCAAVPSSRSEMSVVGTAMACSDRAAVMRPPRLRSLLSRMHGPNE